jgi:serine protease inhibitor
MKALYVCLIALLMTLQSRAADFDLAAKAMNAFAVDLHRQFAGDENLCVSPYSIEAALAMTFAGADGDTRTEMARVLHLPNDGDRIHASFAALQRSFEDLAKRTEKVAQDSKKYGAASEPVTIAVANRLFGQRGYAFREPFQALVKKFYGAPFEALDFQKNPERERQYINNWVADQTRDRIRDLIPPNGISNMTRLVLANAIYLKAPWAATFSESATQPRPFHLRARETVDVRMMNKLAAFGYVKRDGFSAVALPYTGGDLQFLILLPDKVDGLPEIERKLTADLLAQCARLESQNVDLALPKFKLEPPTIALAQKLKAMGMRFAFDEPKGSANFDRIAQHKPNDYLYLSNVFHKTFIAVDEKGTEAAAATAATMMLATGLARPKPPPIVVKVDRPFLYAIQHSPSGACLFLGRVTDPR